MRELRTRRNVCRVPFGREDRRLWRCQHAYGKLASGRGSCRLPTARCPRVHAIYTQYPASCERRINGRFGGLQMYYTPDILWEAVKHSNMRQLPKCYHSTGSLHGPQSRRTDPKQEAKDERRKGRRNAFGSPRLSRALYRKRETRLSRIHM